MRPVPFVARWRAGPVVAGLFEGHLVLDDERVFAGHYPGAPLLPGSFLIEALVQAAREALGCPAQLEEIVACRFHSTLLPGDEVAARFTLKPAEAGGTLVEVSARSRAEAAEVTLRMAPAAGARGSGVACVAAWPPPGSSARVLHQAFIARVLPHRPPALLIDGASVEDPPGPRPTLLARKAITSEEPAFVAADEPSPLLYPRSLVVESFCQACGLLRSASGPAGGQRDQGKAPVVAKLAGLRFAGDVVCGELLEHHVELMVRTEEGAVFSGRSTASGRPVLEVARVVAALAPLSSLRSRI